MHFRRCNARANPLRRNNFSAETSVEPRGRAPSFAPESLVRMLLHDRDTKSFSSLERHYTFVVPLITNDFSTEVALQYSCPNRPSIGEKRTARLLSSRPSQTQTPASNRVSVPPLMRVIQPRSKSGQRQIQRKPLKNRGFNKHLLSVSKVQKVYGTGGLRSDSPCRHQR